MTTSPAPTPVDVAISGGGFAGLSLALALARSIGPELTIAVVEPGHLDSAPAADPRASAISASSRRLLTAIGVWYHVESEAQAVRHAVNVRPSIIASGSPVSPESRRYCP